MRGRHLLDKIVKNIKIKKISLFVIIFGFIFVQNPQIVSGWDDCPSGEVNDEYPGECAKYIDTDNDGICDRSQLAPEDRDSISADEGEAAAKNHQDYEEEHEEEYSVEISGRDLKMLTIEEVADKWGIDADSLLSRIIVEFGLKGEYTKSSLIEDLRDEYKFSPAQVKDIAEDLKADTYEGTHSLQKKEEKIVPYNFGIPFFATIILYLISWVISKKKLIKLYSVGLHNGVWNTVLLISLIPSAIFGFYLVLRYPFSFLRDIKFDFLYWHVEGSIVMGTTAILHLIQRITVYIKQIKLFTKLWD